MSQLKGLRELYDALTSVQTVDDQFYEKLLGRSSAELDKLSHAGFRDRLLSSMQIAAHVAAGALTRNFIFPAGLLIDESLLALRLGVDSSLCEGAWSQVLEALPFKYVGVGHSYFPRWWSRGLEDYWFERIDRELPLVSLTAPERIGRIEKALGIHGLVATELPPGSPGSYPWRFCTLCNEKDPPQLFPIDSTDAVRLTLRSDLPIWVDPPYASLKYALQEREDLRLSRSDLARLTKKYVKQ
ncbi:hypothetical protein BZM26_37700 [Paraburkholderia strydomiana]|nr:hypothetical protein BZM26_37700 [Paraburkholderia strydomiana]